MLTVPLTVRPVLGYAYGFFPSAELQALFRTVDINLTLSLEGPVRLDPDVPSHKQALLKEFAPNDTSSTPHRGLLLLGNHHPQHIANGRLVDEERRGIAVIYQHSRYISDRREEGIFEVCAHEIGHMLNLRHEHAISSDTTVMDISDTRRNGNKRESWRHALNTSQPETRSAIAQFLESYENHNLRTLGFPFSASSRRRLTDDRFLGETLPWSGPFETSSSVWDSAVNHQLSIEVRLDQGSYSVGEPLSFLLIIQNNGQNSLSIPDGISPDSGGTRIFIDRPDGIRFRAHPEATICALDSHEIPPRDQVSIPVVLSDGPGGAVFSIPGNHRLTGDCGVLGLHVPPIEVTVSEAPISVLNNRTFRNFLRTGAPPTRRKQQDILDNLLSSEVATLRPLMKGYFAYRRLLTTSDPNQRAALRSFVYQNHEAKALRMITIVSDIARLSRAGEWEAAEAEIAVIEQNIPEDESHKWFFEAARAHAHTASTDTREGCETWWDANSHSQ